MATLPTKIETPFFKIKLNNVDLTKEYKQFINSISVEYSINTPAIGNISIQSNGYIESFFDVGSKIKIEMGWDRFNLYEMLEGVILVPPNGNAGDNIAFVITIADKEFSKLGKKTRNRTFKVNDKPSIIALIATENGLTPIIDIDDNLSIPQKNVPIQKNKTDLAFLFEQALKWDCLCWMEGKILYFVDSEKAHNNVYSSVYKLNYRLDTNNISNISWEQNKTQGKGISGAGVVGADETGNVSRPEDFMFEAFGKEWKFRPETIKKIKENPSLAIKFSTLIAHVTTNRLESQLTEYFVPITHGNKTNKHKSHLPSHERGGWKINVSLNVGDPSLRPPRKATLHSGNILDSEGKSYLPDFLIRKNNKFNINKVKHTIQNGMLNTSLEMSNSL